MKRVKKTNSVEFDMLPKDIKSYIVRKIIFRIVAFVLLELGSVLLLLALLRSYYDFHPWVFLVVGAVIFILPFFLVGFPHMLLDRNWRGKITAVDIKTGVDSCMIGGKPHMYIKNSIILTIEKENGKICTKEVLSLGATPSNADHGWECRDLKFGIGRGCYAVGDVTHDIENYRIGDEVYHCYGLDDLIVRREGGRSIVECIVCSTTNPAYRNDCFCCGRTLMKF